MIQNNYCKSQIKKGLFLFTLILFCISIGTFSQTPIPANKVDTILFNNFLFTKSKTDTISSEYKLELFNYYSQFNCLSGTIYFSGNGFYNTVVIQYRGKATDLKPYFERCISGSKFTIDNCSFERDGGLKPILVMKTIIFR